MEAIGTASKCLRNLDTHRKLLKTVTPKKEIPGWFVLRVLHDKLVILYSDIILTVLKTLVFSIQIQLYAYPSFWA